MPDGGVRQVARVREENLPWHHGGAQVQGRDRKWVTGGFFQCHWQVVEGEGGVRGVKRVELHLTARQAGALIFKHYSLH